MLVLSSGNLFLWWVRSFLIDEPPQLSLSDKSFYLLLQVVAVRCVMTVIMVKAAVLVSGPFIRVSFQLAGKCQGSFVLDLHQDLVDRARQRGEGYEPPSGGFGAPILLLVSSSCCLLPPVLPCLLLSFPLLRLLFSGQQHIFCVHVLSCPVEYI